jgi:hypothetical protein
MTMKRAEVAEVIRRAFEKGIPFEKVDCFLLAEVPELTVSKLARPIAKAARGDEAEAEKLEDLPPSLPALRANRTSQISFPYKKKRTRTRARRRSARRGR